MKGMTPKEISERQDKLLADIRKTRKELASMG